MLREFSPQQAASLYQCKNKVVSEDLLEFQIKNKVVSEDLLEFNKKKGRV